MDPRLAYNRSEFIYIKSDRSAIWHPDLFFSGERLSSQPGAVQPGEALLIYPNGRVLLSTTISQVIYCPHDYSIYPFDEPGCLIEMGSYAYTSEELDIFWREIPWAIEINPKLGSPNFAVTVTDHGYCVTPGVSYSCLHFKLKMQRLSRKVFLQNFIPTIFLLIISFSTFWLNRSYFRISLSAVSFIVLTINLMFNMSTRPNQLVTALDKWNIFCFIFSFASLLVNIILDYRFSRDEKSPELLNSNSNDNNPNSTIKEQLIFDTSSQVQLTWLQKLKKTNFNNENSVISCVRITFPFLLIIFIIIYTFYVICSRKTPVYYWF